MAELKPCPFCGSTKLKIESKSTRAGWTGIDALVEQDTYSVRCNVCHARGGTAGGKVIKSLRYMYKDNMPEWATTSEAVKERAIEAWNKRTEPERPKGGGSIITSGISQFVRIAVLSANWMLTSAKPLLAPTAVLI